MTPVLRSSSPTSVGGARAQAGAPRSVAIRLGALVGVFALAAASLPLGGPGARVAEGCDTCVRPARSSLSNGLTCIFCGNHRDRQVLVLMAYHVGARDEPPRGAGTARVVEHMLARAPLPSFPAAGRDPDASRAAGSDVTHDLTWFSHAVERDDLERALRLEAERMRSAVLDEELFRRERERCLREAAESELNPVRRLWGALYAAAFRVHPYGRPRRGLPEDLRDLSEKAARDFQRAFFHPDNATLVLVGDLPEPGLALLVERVFGDIPRSAGIPVPLATEPPQTEARRVVLEAPGAPARLLLGFRLPAVEHPDHPALLALRAALGARLGRIPDFEGKARSAGLRPESPLDYRDPHLLLLSAEAVSPDALTEVEARLRQAVEELSSQVLPAADVEAAKKRAAAELAGPSTIDPPPAGEGDYLSRFYVDVALALARRARRAAYLDGDYRRRLGEVDGARMHEAAAKYLVRANATSAVGVGAAGAGR
ncbi:MAG: insulinase family protein [Planctomycetes bacterium]|nr:insulinase family protein [Planctomycetota bacterium]